MRALVHLWFCLGAGASASSPPRVDSVPSNASATGGHRHGMLARVTVCTERTGGGQCTGDCKSYLPSAACFNPRRDFPADPQWGESDLRDELNATHIVRSLYNSMNASCSGPPTGGFTVRLGECVGPFGKPRPWGVFALASPPGAAPANR